MIGFCSNIRVKRPFHGARNRGPKRHGIGTVCPNKVRVMRHCRGILIMCVVRVWTAARFKKAGRAFIRTRSGPMRRTPWTSTIKQWGEMHLTATLSKLVQSLRWIQVCVLYICISFSYDVFDVSVIFGVFVLFNFQVMVIANTRGYEIGGWVNEGDIFSYKSVNEDDLLIDVSLYFIYTIYSMR